MSMPRTLDEALEEIAWLKRELGQVRDGERVAKLQNRWGLTGSEATILDVLYAKGGKPATRQAFLCALYDDTDEAEEKIIDVFICKIRNKFGRHHVKTIWGRGYFLTEEGLAMCKAVVEADRMPARLTARHGRVEELAA